MLAEHWDIVSAEPDTLPHGNGLFWISPATGAERVDGAILVVSGATWRVFPLSLRA
jgi:hypothetical protein